VQQGNASDSIETGNLPTTIQPIPLENPATEDVEKRRELSEEILKERKQLAGVSDQFEQVLAPFIDDKLVSVKKNDYWIELEMNSELLFLSGEAELSKKAIPVLEKIAEVLKPLPNMVNIEGHTDDVPIENVKFRSNWDLSSARATSVVHEFVKEGINPLRLAAIGYGEFHPIGDNKLAEERFKNRRVVLVLMSQAFARYGANDEERAKLLNLIPTAPAAGKP
jgi:chemotaxis protein MotB